MHNASEDTTSNKVKNDQIPLWKLIDDLYESVDPNDPKEIKAIVDKLKAVIDDLARNFANAKSLILELARLMDETKQCEQSKICSKIKQILKEKIADGKITGKWIEKCVPQEYKRKYIVKSELSSLSLDDKDTRAAEKILIYASGHSSNSLNSDNSSSNTTTEENKSKFMANKLNQNNIQCTLDNQGKSSSERDRLRYKELEGTVPGPESVVSAENILQKNVDYNDKTYRIPKDKYDLLISAIKSSHEYCSVVFDNDGILVHAKSDISPDPKGQWLQY